ncbi:HAMP domain-containing protein [Paenibacillus cremeus]|uniref:histidine kinase n=2 Tax=Paenibacillus cremeus TaxID=2163881 RepID=A0A559KAB1_9BACL|nr:HAMP domain-containing protein [Paenibacillus cremeus]
MLRSLILFTGEVYQLAREQVKRSLRLQLILTFAFCLLAYYISHGIASSLIGNINKGTIIDYSQGRERIDYDARDLVRILDPQNTEYNTDDSGDSGEVGAPPPVPPVHAVPAPPVPSVPEAGVQQGGTTSGAAVETPGAPSAAANGTAGAPANGTPSGTPSGTPAVPGTPAAPQKGTDAQAVQRKRQQEEARQRDFMNTVTRMTQFEKYKILITDLEGKVVYRNANAHETLVDVHSVIRNAMEPRNENSDVRTEFSSFYPITYNNQKSYLIVSGIPQPRITYQKGESPLSYVLALAVFIFLFYYLTKRKMRYIEELASGLRVVSTGNLDHRVVVRSQDELGELAINMNAMVSELQRTIEEERRAERLKNELVTNVSHDLRTPLTLIMGYLRLLHDKNYETPEQAASYASIAYSKSEKLKSLIDDLFEYTKLSNQDVPLNKRGVVINEVLEQLLEEYVSLSEEQQLTLVRSLPPERLTVRIDVDQMIRVFENLLSNAIKYSLKPGTITVLMTHDRTHVLIRISNQADNLTPDELEQLFDRFYRVDQARTSDFGGSGLGLAIARSIVESHEGSIWAESEDGQIHFYVKLKLAS